MNFKDLINLFKETDVFLKQKAYYAINQALTIRNWLYGFYIFEFEQKGEDRAVYGEKLIASLAAEMKRNNIKGMSMTNLLLSRQFYKTYPEIVYLFKNNLNTIYQALSDKFEHKPIYQALSDKLNKPQSANENNYGVTGELLISKLSFSHLIELIKLDEPLNRAFYEIECIKGNWSVRELQRQIGSLLFERTGLSSNKEKMIELANVKSTHFLPDEIIRDPYIFEFLGLKQTEVIPETSFEDMLILHLQEFLLELGKGFCFEARQRRITIDNKHFYIDLVFYHKILKCNVIIELKTRGFEHADASQLRVYLNYYRKNEMHNGDNPPIGILLCTNKSEELVEYSTTGIEEQIFISKYMLELPSKEELQMFLHNQLLEFGVKSL